MDVRYLLQKKTHPVKSSQIDFQRRLPRTSGPLMGAVYLVTFRFKGGRLFRKKRTRRRIKRLRSALREKGEEFIKRGRRVAPISIPYEPPRRRVSDTPHSPMPILTRSSKRSDEVARNSAPGLLSDTQQPCRATFSQSRAGSQTNKPELKS